MSHPTVRGSQWEQRPEHHVRAAYREAMARHGLTDLARVVHSGYSEEGCYRGAMELLTSTRPPTAIFAGADVAATGAFRAAAELGLRIPVDLSLAGYNNTSVAALAPVSLTSVDQSGAMMGETAARLLLERIEKRRDRAVALASTPHLVARGSTAPPPEAPDQPALPPQRVRRVPGARTSNPREGRHNFLEPLLLTCRTSPPQG